ncbi:hypothetical protein DL93DRAFT_2091796 [Clavulina sp. PMI_390]|nr:hypothetical protein DL93DRAFT_2091796 [Clavulina sp. PMI_390]
MLPWEKGFGLHSLLVWLFLGCVNLPCGTSCIATTSFYAPRIFADQPSCYDWHRKSSSSLLFPFALTAMFFTTRASQHFVDTTRQPTD